MSKKCKVWVSGIAAIIVIVGVLAWGLGENLQAAVDAEIHGTGTMKFPVSSMTIVHADGTKFDFSVEVAQTLEQEEYGLMYRRSLPRDAGMIFLYDPDQDVSMWMKNTYIPLDMLYVRRDGTIAKIVTNAQPFDLTPLPSGEPVHEVIELNGGEVGRRGVQVGDKVLFPGLSGQK